MKTIRLFLLGTFVIALTGYLNLSSEATNRSKKNVNKIVNQVDISDSVYNLADWNVNLLLDSIAPGNSHSYEQKTTGGNPGSYLSISYELLATNNPSYVFVTYRYTGAFYIPQISGAISSVTYKEDVKRFTSFPPFVYSWPAVFQGGKIFVGNIFYSFNEGWLTHTTNMVDTNYNSIPYVPGLRPDFSASGDTIWFGFFRGLIATDMLQNETYTHGSDNFSVTIYSGGGSNNPPVAVNDLMVIEAGGVSTISPIRNDYDPDGDPIWIDSVFGFWNCSASLVPEDSTFVNVSISDIDGEFYYRITDGNLSDIARVTVLADCGCYIHCLGTLDKNNKINRSTIQQDTLDLDLIRRFRDEVMKPSYHGSRYVDMYYETTPEILYIILIEEPGLATQAVAMVELLQPAIRNLLDGDGQEPIILEQIKAMQTFFSNLSAAGSQSLQQLIAEELQRLGPLENYIGIPISDVIFQTMVTDVEDDKSSIPSEFNLAQNYPNPFNPTTSIQYSVPQRSNVALKVYDVLGKEITALVNEEKDRGVYNVRFDATGLASGIYFYRIQAGSFVETKKMILIR